MNFKSHFLPIATLVMLLAVSCTTTQRAYGQDDYNNDYNNNYSQNDQNDNNYQGDEEPLIQPSQDVNFDQFYNDLSPYGRWIDNPSYGRVWVSSISGFRPYSTGGHWAYTHFGWTWVSDYNWGWAPFHYGRWAFDASYGWFWVPGYTWGPAWVSWRNGGDYYGWAPLSPGVNISIGFGSGIAAANWVFMPHRYMGYSNIAPYYVRPQRNVTIIKSTTIINNTNVYNNNRYVVGPQRQEVERYTRRQIQPQNIYVTNRTNVQRQDNSGIHLYRPQPVRGNTMINNRNAAENNMRNNNPNIIQNNNNVQQPANRNNLPNRAWNSPAQQPNRAIDNGINNNNQVQPNFNNRQQRQIDRRLQEQNNQQNNNLQQQNNRQQGWQDMQQRRLQMQNNQQNAQQQDINRQQQIMQQRQQQMQDRRQQEINRQQQLQNQYQQQREQQQQRQQDIMQGREQTQQMQERQQRQNQMMQQRQMDMQQRQQQMQQMQQQRQQQMNQMRQQQMQNRNAGSSSPQSGGRQFQPQQQRSGGSRRGF